MRTLSVVITTKRCLEKSKTIYAAKCRHHGVNGRWKLYVNELFEYVFEYKLGIFTGGDDDVSDDFPPG